MKRNVRLLLSVGMLLTLPSLISPPQAAVAEKAKEIVPYTTAESFSKDVLKSTLPVMVDFSGTWCAPCREMAPKVDNLAVKYAGKMKFFKVDIDDDEDLADDLNVEALPTFMVFDHGCIVKTSHGNVGAAKLDADITDTLAPSKSLPVQTVEKPSPAPPM